MRLFRGRFTSLWFLLELTNCGFHIGKVFKQMVYKIRGKHALKKSQCLQDQIFNRQTRRVLLGTLGGVCRLVLQNPDPISNQQCHLHTRCQWHLKSIHVSDLASRQKLCHDYLD